jgi:hypothetical protein
MQFIYTDGIRGGKESSKTVSGLKLGLFGIPVQENNKTRDQDVRDWEKIRLGIGTENSSRFRTLTMKIEKKVLNLRAQNDQEKFYTR